MYGWCHSKGAIEAITKCTPVVTNDIGGCTWEFADGEGADTFSESKNKINGAPTVDNMTIDEDIGKSRRFSILEFYISLKGAKNEEVIKHLRGETKELEL